MGAEIIFYYYYILKMYILEMGWNDLSHVSLLFASLEWKQLVSYVIFVFAKSNGICKVVSIPQNTYHSILKPPPTNVFFFFLAHQW